MRGVGSPPAQKTRLYGCPQKNGGRLGRFVDSSQAQAQSAEYPRMTNQGEWLGHHPAHHIGASPDRGDTILALQHGVGLLSFRRNRHHSHYCSHPRVNGPNLNTIFLLNAPAANRVGCGSVSWKNKLLWEEA
jgi:hypothetical protein